MSAPQATMPLGVVLERRRIDHPWAEFSWRAAAVIPGAPAAPAASPGGEDRVHAATLLLGLHRKQTEGYRENLSQPAPAVYVVLRQGEAGVPRPFLVTVCPYEAQNYDMGGDERVDAVPMPPPVAALLARFVAEHHVDEPFRKRRRTPSDPAGPKPARKGSVGGPRYG